jgi:hypothetical protein
LQIPHPEGGCFCPKIGAILQKNGGPTEIILHFFQSFHELLGFFPSQAVAFQPQAAIQPLPKKSCLKTYRRFFVRPGMCHHRRMNDDKFDVERLAAVKPARVAWPYPFAAIGKTLGAICPICPIRPIRPFSTIQLDCAQLHLI